MVQEKSKAFNKKSIPEYLIYEMDEGKPIYYKGYKDVLNKTKTAEQIKASTLIHSLLISGLRDLFQSKLGKGFAILMGELGVQFAKKSWRSTDIAIFKKKVLLQQKIEDKYAAIPPEIVVEVDTKAALEDLNEPMNYFFKKTDQLLQFGVQKVLWIFTAEEKFMLAEQGKKWETGNWNEDVKLLPDLEFSIRKLLDEYLEEK